MLLAALLLYVICCFVATARTLLLPQSSKSAPNVVSEWSNTKSATEKAMKLMQMYKDLGDFEQQVGPERRCSWG
jgi:hypothetical protein